MVLPTLDYYQKNAKEVIKRYEKADMSKLHEKLKKAFTLGSKLLEIGCGSGRDAAVLHKEGYNVIISDASKNMLDEAIRVHPEFKGKGLYLTLPDKTPFESEYFNGVYAIAMLMHLNKDEIERTLKEINRILLLKGKFFFSIPLIRDDINKEGLDDKGRLFTLLTEEEWVKLCIRSGFELLKLDKNWDNMGRLGILWGSFLLEKVRKNS